MIEKRVDCSCGRATVFRFPDLVSDQDFLDQAMIAAMQGIMGMPCEERPRGSSYEGIAIASCKQAKALLEERNKMIGGGE